MTSASLDRAQRRSSKRVKDRRQSSGAAVSTRPDGQRVINAPDAGKGELLDFSRVARGGGGSAAAEIRSVHLVPQVNSGPGLVSVGALLRANGYDTLEKVRALIESDQRRSNTGATMPPRAGMPEPRDHGALAPLVLAFEEQIKRIQGIRAFFRREDGDRLHYMAVYASDNSFAGRDAANAWVSFLDEHPDAEDKIELDIDYWTEDRTRRLAARGYHAVP